MEPLGLIIIQHPSRQLVSNLYDTGSQYYPAGNWLNGNLNGSAVNGVSGFGGGFSTYPI